jgi:hypothetical protein
MTAGRPPARGAEGDPLGGASEAPSLPMSEDALVAALTLDPSTFSRNRFFELYRSQTMQRARRRAARLRSLVRLLAVAGAEVAREALADGEHLVRVRVPALGLERTVRLTELEASLLEYLVARLRGEPLAESDVDRLRVEACLSSLAGEPLHP